MGQMPYLIGTDHDSKSIHIQVCSRVARRSWQPLECRRPTLSSLFSLSASRRIRTPYFSQAVTPHASNSAIKPCAVTSDGFTTSLQSAQPGLKNMVVWLCHISIDGV